jgi:hypothetical protein
MNIAHNLELWLSLVWSKEGLGAEVAFQVVSRHRGYCTAIGAKI